MNKVTYKIDPNAKYIPKFAFECQYLDKTQLIFAGNPEQARLRLIELYPELADIEINVINLEPN